LTIGGGEGREVSGGDAVEDAEVVGLFAAVIRAGIEDEMGPDVEEGEGGELEAGFFEEFTVEGLLGGFAKFEAAAGEIPASGERSAAFFGDEDLGVEDGDGVNGGVVGLLVILVFLAGRGGG